MNLYTLYAIENLLEYTLFQSGFITKLMFNKI